jgi:hypothetical protein
MAIVSRRSASLSEVSGLEAQARLRLVAHRLWGGHDGHRVAVLQGDHVPCRVKGGSVRGPVGAWPPGQRPGRRRLFLPGRTYCACNRTTSTQVPSPSPADSNFNHAVASTRRPHRHQFPPVTVGVHALGILTCSKSGQLLAAYLPSMICLCFPMRVGGHLRLPPVLPATGADHHTCPPGGEEQDCAGCGACSACSLAGRVRCAGRDTAGPGRPADS